MAEFRPETAPEPNMTIRFTQPRRVLDHVGKVVEKFSVGQVVELSASSARHWLNRNAARIVGAAADAETAEDAEPRPEGNALMAAIAAAIDGLDDNEDYTKDGVPKVEALERELGYGISASERDDAWASVSGSP